MQVLSRRTKNNPVLIGEPGVGKTAIVEGIALRIAAGDVPESLRDKKILSLDLGRAHRRHQVPRRVRGPAEGRAQGDRSRRRRDHPVHRRAAHAGRCGRRRGRRGRGQHAEAGAGARRAALHRRHDAGRVPQVHREGQGARAPVPAGLRRRAVDGGHRSRSCAASRSGTRSTTASASATPRWSPRPGCRTATSRAASCPTRRSTSSTRRPAASRCRSTRAPTPIDQLERRLTSLAIEEQALSREKDEASAKRLGRRSPRRSPSCASAPTGMKGGWQREKALIAELRKAEGRDRDGQDRGGAGAAARRSATAPPSCASARPRAREGDARQGTKS